VLVGSLDTTPTEVMGILTLYDASTGAEVRRFGADRIAYHNVINDAGVLYFPIAFSPDGRQILSSSTLWDESERSLPTFLQLWDVATGTLIREHGPVPIYTGDFRAQVAALSFNASGDRIAAITSNEATFLWDVATGEMLQSLRYSYGAYSVTFSPDGNTILVGEVGGVITLWDAESGQFIRRLGLGVQVIEFVCVR
jgi:WD40 repeat protein